MHISRQDRARRFQKQLMLKEWGEAGQQKLEKARVLVIGAGGLGCPALLYLAGAGVGRLGIVDDDTVSLSNLHRQVLYTMDDIGKPKAEVAAERLRRLNGHTVYDVFKLRMKREQSRQIISGYDLVLDGSDNFPTRLMVSDACAHSGKPLVYGAVFRFEGQLGVLHPATRGSTYRDVFPQVTRPGAGTRCESEGVIGVIPGVVGTLMAAEAIKILSGAGSSLDGKLLVYRCLDNVFYEVDLDLAAEREARNPFVEPAT